MNKMVMPAVYTVFAVGLTGTLLYMSLPSFGEISDFPEYYSAAKLVLSGEGAKIYALQDFSTVEQQLFPELKGRIVGFFVPPFAMAWIIPIGFLPLPAAIYVWKLILIAALIASLFLLSRAFRLSKPGVLYLIAVTALSGATYEALRIDQLATILLLGLSMLIYGVKKEMPWLSAAGLSLMIIKPQEALPLIVYLFAAKQYGLLLRAIPVSGVIAVIGFLAIGVDGIRNYSELMASTVNDTRFLVSDLSPSLRGQLLRMFPAQGEMGALVSLVFLAVSIGAIAFIGRRMSKAKQWLEAGLLVALPLGFASCFYFFQYDLVLLLPALIVLMREDVQKQIPAPILLLGMCGALIFLLPFSILIHYYYLLPGGPFNPNFIALLVFALALVFFVLKRKDLFA